MHEGKHWRGSWRDHKDSEDRVCVFCHVFVCSEMDTRVAESLAFVFNGSNMFSRWIINPLRDLAHDNPRRLQTGNPAGLDRWKLGGLVTQVGPKTQYRALYSPDLCFSSQCLCLTSLFTPSVHFHNKSLTGCTRLYGYTAEKCAVKCNTDGATGPGVGFLLDKKSARNSRQNSKVKHRKSCWNVTKINI